MQALVRTPFVMRLGLETSEYTLEVENARFKLRQHTGPENQDAWINGRQGDLQHSTLTATAINGTCRVYFDGRDIGTVPADDNKNIDSLFSLIKYYNSTLGPTDLQTARTALLLSQGRDIVNQRNTISTFNLTWNMFGSLSKLDQSQVEQLVDYSRDVLILNFQETDALNRNLVANQQTLASAIEIFKRPSHKLVSFVQLLGLMTLVFVKEDLRVSDVRKDSSGVGFLRVWGNKGAVMTRFKLLTDSTLGGGAEFVVVNCHLSAGDNPDQNNRRRWELREISKKFGVENVVSADDQFDPAAYEFDVSDASDEEVEELPARYRKSLPKEPAAESPPMTQVLSKSPDSKPKVPEKDYDIKPLPTTPPEDSSLPQFIILAGDLNYRVSGDPETVRGLAKNEKYATILEKDFCSKLHHEKKILDGFYEHPITFAPTYKFKLGSAIYDTNSRTPSYTDRIFYGGDLKFDIDKYTSVPLTLSDHQPVLSTGTVEFTSVDWEKHTKLVDTAYRMVDRAENLAIPNIQVEPNSITSHVPIFSIPCESIKLVSQSNRPVSWRITPNDNVQATPMMGILEPNASQRLTVKSFMGADTDTINEIIIVQVEGGADRFISIIFEKSPTLIGQPLADLETKDGLPLVIVACVEYLWSRVVPELFSSQGELCIIQQVIEWFDKRQTLDVEVLDTANSTSHDAGSTSIARVLYLITTMFAEPLLTSEQAVGAIATQMYIRETLPKASADLVLYLVRFFRHIKDFGCPVGGLVDPLQAVLMGKNAVGGRDLVVGLLTSEDW